MLWEMVGNSDAVLGSVSMAILCEMEGWEQGMVSRLGQVNVWCAVMCNAQNWLEFRLWRR